MKQHRSGAHRMTIETARESITQTMGWTTYRPLTEGTTMATEIAEATVSSEFQTPRTPLVYRRWTEVMAHLGGLAKRERALAGATKFNFRGIDAVMNAAGPVFREYGIAVIPRVVDHRGESYTTAKGAVMRGVVVHVEYIITATDGSTMVGSAFGEASDSGDKATPKAMSVAYRTFLLQALTLPTDEPDPDTFIHERSSEQTATAAKPEGPPITQEQADEIGALFDTLVLDEHQRAHGIVTYTGRETEVADLTEHEAEQILVPLRRKVEAKAGAPTQEEAEARVAQSLGGVPVEEGQ